MAGNAFDKEPAIWIDATGCLNWGPQPPVGVIRVETEIVKAALVNPELGLAYIDNASGHYVAADPSDIEYLDWLYGSGQSSEKPRTSYLKKQLKFNSKETARRIPEMILGKRKGLAYHALKAATRVVLSVYNVARHLSMLSTKRRVIEDCTIFASFMSNQKTRFFRRNRTSSNHFVHMIHDIIPLKLPHMVQPHQTKRLSRFFAIACERGDDFITVSNGTEVDVRKWFAEKGLSCQHSTIQTCQLLELGIDEKGAQTPIKGLIDKQFALFCSSFNPRKNHDFMVEVWAELFKKFGNSLPLLVFVGRAEPTRQTKDALDRAGPSADHIILLGEISEEELRWAYAHAWLSVLPSSEEGWGLGISESLRFGTPIIHTDAPQMREAASDLMPALADRDLDLWKSELSRMILNKDAYEGLRRKAEEYRFAPDHEAFGTRFTTVMKQLTRARRSS